MRKLNLTNVLILTIAVIGLLCLPGQSMAQRVYRGGGYAGYRGAYAYRGGYAGYYRPYSYGAYSRPYYYGAYSRYNYNYAWRPNYSLYLGWNYYPYGVYYQYPIYTYPSYSLYAPTVYAPTYSTLSSSPYGGSGATSSQAVVEVHVPSADANVWFDDAQTSQKGTVRTFASPDLTPGQSYTYHVRAHWTANGQPVDQTRTVSVQPGQSAVVDFTAPAREIVPPPAPRK